MSYMSSPNMPSFSDVPFDATNFTANNAMTWIVLLAGQVTYRWALQGGLLTLCLQITGTVGGTPSTKLFVKLPNGLRAKSTVSFIAEVNSFGTGHQFGFGDVAAGGTQLNFQTSLAAPFANWGAGSATVNFLGAIEVQL